MITRHADLMLQYAQDAQNFAEPYRNWQMRSNGDWIGLKFHPAWNENHDYRRLPPTIIVNGVQVPQSTVNRDDLSCGTEYFVPTPTRPSLISTWVWYGDNPVCEHHLQMNIIYFNKEDAIQRAKAMLKFTS